MKSNKTENLTCTGIMKNNQLMNEIISYLRFKASNLFISSSSSGNPFVFVVALELPPGFVFSLVESSFEYGGGEGNITLSDESAGGDGGVPSLFFE